MDGLMEVERLEFPVSLCALHSSSDAYDDSEPEIVNEKEVHHHR